MYTTCVHMSLQNSLTPVPANVCRYTCLTRLPPKICWYVRFLCQRHLWDMCGHKFLQVRKIFLQETRVLALIMSFYRKFLAWTYSETMFSFSHFTLQHLITAPTTNNSFCIVHFGGKRPVKQLPLSITLYSKCSSITQSLSIALPIFIKLWVFYHLLSFNLFLVLCVVHKSLLYIVFIYVV